MDRKWPKKWLKLKQSGKLHICGIRGLRINALSRLHCDVISGGVMMYVIEDIRAKLIIREKLAIEGFYVELNSRKQKWLISCSYNPKLTSISQHIEA